MDVLGAAGIGNLAYSFAVAFRVLASDAGALESGRRRRFDNTYRFMANVLIYTTPTCVYCKMAKEFFKKNNVSYQEFNVAEDEKAREEMVHKSGQLGVPVIEIDGKIIVGFDESGLRKALGL